MINIIIVMAILALSLFGIQKRQDEDAFSIEQGNCIKGISALLIVLIHIGNALENPGSYKFLSSMGYLFVAIFSFIPDMA